MSSKRDPQLWLEDILDSIREIEDATHQIEAETFFNNRLLHSEIPRLCKEGLGEVETWSHPSFS